jgi:hypothetical protein
MTQVLLTEALRNMLPNLSEPLELCNEAGQIVACVVPMLDLSQYELVEPPISREEIRRREQSDKWYTTDEVLAHLKRLENS